jgi:dolichol-phosphate mannosyltransferase
MNLSTVIPLYNESSSLEALYAELCDVARKNDYQLEFVFVDDGSTDGSWDIIERLARDDPRVRGISFRRNFGKAAALRAGFAAASGSLVMTLDADLQDDPQEIPRFVAAMGDGRDVVSGWKFIRHDPWHKVWPSRVFNWLVGALTGVWLHDHNCGFKCYRREVLNEVKLYGELHRFVPVLAASRGWKVGEIIVQHRARRYGRSKYGVGRIIKGILDLFTVYFLTAFGRRPQHLLGSLGLFAFFGGTVGVLTLTVMWFTSRLDGEVANDVHLHERALFYYSMGAVLLGAQFLSVGLLAELFTAFAGEDVLPYSIKSQIGGSFPASGNGHPGGGPVRQSACGEGS